MAKIKEIEFVDILNELPDINRLNCERELLDQKYDVFICALGFEERCLTIPENLAKTRGFKCKEAIYFEYSTNVEDNEVNKPRLTLAFRTFADSFKSFQCNEEDFAKKLREFLSQIVKSNENPKLIFDISVCSSKLLLSVMNALLELDIYLKIVYSEAAVYHPTSDEFEKEPEKWVIEENFGIARGVGKVIPSPDYPGAYKENPNLIVAFLTFKPERTRAIITDIDETLSIKPDKRIIWIVGDPHMEAKNKRKRKKMMLQINNIPKGCPTYEICTFDYKKSIKKLDKIYNDYYLDFHINISALGSKMQTLGIAIFCYVRPDVSVYFAMPKEYNSKQYSEGCKETWQIEFKDFKNVKGMFDKIGQLEIIKGV